MRRFFKKSRGLRRFGRDESGVTTVEFVIWLPLLMITLLIMVQATTLFLAQSNYGSVARDTARLVARHALTTKEAADYAKQHAAVIGRTPEVNVAIQNGMVDVHIRQFASHISSFNFLNLMDGFEVESRIIQAMEPI